MTGPVGKSEDASAASGNFNLDAGLPAGGGALSPDSFFVTPAAGSLAQPTGTISPLVGDPFAGLAKFFIREATLGIVFGNISSISSINAGPQDNVDIQAFLDESPGGGFALSVFSFGRNPASIASGRGIDGLGSLLNASKFDRFLRTKGGGLQFLNQGSAKRAFNQLITDFNVSPSDVVKRSGGVVTFRKGNRTFTLRSDSKGGNTISVKTDHNVQQIVTRFGQE